MCDIMELLYHLTCERRLLIKGLRLGDAKRVAASSDREGGCHVFASDADPVNSNTAARRGTAVPLTTTHPHTSHFYPPVRSTARYKALCAHDPSLY